MITPGTLASPLSFWCLDAKGGASSIRFFGDLHGKEHKVVSCWFYACVLVSFRSLKLSLAWCKTCATAGFIQNMYCNI